MPTTFVWLTRRALKGGPTEPSNGGKYFFYDYTGLHRDASGNSLLRRCQPCATIPATAAPRRALRRHPRRCWSARGQDVATPVVVPRTDPH
jgi:hypothetical protein